MKKLYDFEAAIKYIQMHADLIDCALLGIGENWFWSAEVIYADGKFTIPIKDISKLKIGYAIGHSNGSDWGTPTLEIEFKDESTLFKKCYIGYSIIETPEWFNMGTASKTCKIMHNKIKHLT